MKNSKKKHLIQFGIIPIVLLLLVACPVLAEFVPYEIEENQREILGNTADETLNSTDIVKYNYVGQVVIGDADEYGPNFERTGNTYKVYPGEQFIYINNDFHYLEYATTTKEIFDLLYSPLTSSIPFVNIVKAETIYAGNMRGMYSDDANWYIVHNDSSADVLRSAGSNKYNIMSMLTGGVYYIERQPINFDLSAITDTITACTLHIFASGDSGDGDQEYGFTGSTHTDVDNADSFNDSDNNLLSDTVYDDSDFTDTNELEYIFNAYGLSDINDALSSTFRIMARENKYDIGSTTPSSNSTYVNFYSSFETGTTYDPYLEITVSAEEEEEEEETASTTLSSSPELLPLLDDITIFTSYVETYTTSTTSPSSYQIGYYRIPFIGFLIFAFIFLYIGGRILLELIIRWRA